MEQLLGVAAGNFQAIRFADGSLVEPTDRLGHVVERVVHGVQTLVQHIKTTGDKDFLLNKLIEIQ